MSERRPAHRGQRGAVGGLEALVIGFLVLFGGLGLIVNAWSVVETRTALDAAAREYLRSYTEQSSAGEAEQAGERAARDVLRRRGTPLHQLRLTPPDPTTFGPCARATVTLAVDVPELRVPFIAALGPSSVQVTASELVDAHRELVAGNGHDLDRTLCGG